MRKPFTTKVEIPEFVVIPTSDYGCNNEIARVNEVYTGYVHVTWDFSVREGPLFCSATYTILKHAIVEPTTADWIRHAERLGYEIS